MVELRELFDRALLGNSLLEWTIAAGTTIGVLFVLLLLRRIVRASYQRMAATPKTELMELPLRVLSRTGAPFLFLIAIFAGVQTLDVPSKLQKVLVTIITIVAFWQVGVWASTAVVGWLDRKQQRTMEVDRAAAGTFGIIAFIARALIWVLVLLLTLDNLGINITTLVAGLGIGGIAVALAVQNVLGDLLASLSITLDRPFVVGDAIAVDDFNGTVEQIGVKSVRLRSVTGEQIIMPNANLLASRVRNYGRMRERRVVLSVAVSIDTPREKLERVPVILKGLIETEKDARFDRCHFAKVSSAAAEFEGVFYVLTPDYKRYMDIQQRINFGIIEAFAKEAIQFAQSVQKLSLEGASLQARLHEGESKPQAPG